MINSDKINKIVYGGDYNPEQWTEDIWLMDMKLFKLAGIDIVTLNVFSWAALQKSDYEYDFSTLDKIVDMVTKNDLKICFATSTGAHPAWMAKKYPEILRVNFEGKKHKFGGRHNSCPNSKIYRKFSSKLASLLSERYGKNENIVGWHISNEFGGECYCENCEEAFRQWLKEKYKTIENVNKAWNTSFWGHTFYEFDEIVLPNLLSEHFAKDRTMFQGITLDYKRFNSDSLLECYKLEKEAIQKHSNIPITTNLMGAYKELDYFKWAKEMDFVSWDAYPSYNFTYSEIAFPHTLQRGLKDGKPFILMEQTPSSTNWQQINSVKRPNVMRLLSYQAVAHGSDGVMFFQLRRSIGACEKYHGAVIDHVGHENTRVFREVATLGKELKKLENKTLNSKVNAKVGIIFDWNNWWAFESSAGPSYRVKYLEEILSYYKALHTNNIPVDMISIDTDFEKYDLVIAPTLYMVKKSYDEKIRKYVKDGGKFLTTFLSGHVDENDLVQIGGYPYVIRDVMGIWVEEVDDLPENVTNSFKYKDNTYTTEIIGEVIHLEGAEAISTFEKDYYKGHPSVTVNSFGKGEAYYIGAKCGDDFYEKIILDLCQEFNIKKVMSTPYGVEACIRENDENKILFILNHNDKTEEITLEHNCYDLLNDREYSKGTKISISKYDVFVFKI